MLTHLDGQTRIALRRPLDRDRNARSRFDKRRLPRELQEEEDMGSVKAFIASQIREDDGTKASAFTTLAGSLVAAIASGAALLDVNGIFTSVGSKVMALLAGT